MDMTGEHRIEASREAVWEALNDPEVLKESIPGCQELTKEGDTDFTATVKAKVGPVSAKFSGAVTLSDIDPPNGYTISGEGKGGAAGFAKGGAKVNLEDDGGATLLKYEVNASVGGKLAQIGSRLIDSTAKKMAGQFFAKFAEVVESRSAGSGGDAADDAAPAPAAEAAPPAAAEAKPAPEAPPPPPPPSAEPPAGSDTPTTEPDEPAPQPPSDGPLAPPPDQAAQPASAMNPYVWVGAVAGFVIVLLLIWAFGGF